MCLDVEFELGEFGIELLISSVISMNFLFNFRIRNVYFLRKTCRISTCTFCIINIQDFLLDNGRLLELK